MCLCTVQKEIEALERTVQEKNGEIRQLQKENAELERAKHTEVVKLRLEVGWCRHGYNSTCCYSVLLSYSMMLKC